jgi:hypothetical protein
MNWSFWFEALAAIYLVGTALIIQTSDSRSNVFFKIVPMAIGLPLAVAVILQLVK